jgi:hypothetical protein
MLYHIGTLLAVGLAALALSNTPVVQIVDVPNLGISERIQVRKILFSLSFKRQKRCNPPKPDAFHYER